MNTNGSVSLGYSDKDVEKYGLLTEEHGLGLDWSIDQLRNNTLDKHVGPLYEMLKKPVLNPKKVSPFQAAVLTLAALRPSSKIAIPVKIQDKAAEFFDKLDQNLGKVMTNPEAIDPKQIELLGAEIFTLNHAAGLISDRVKADQIAPNGIELQNKELVSSLIRLSGIHDEIYLDNNKYSGILKYSLQSTDGPFMKMPYSIYEHLPLDPTMGSWILEQLTKHKNHQNALNEAPSQEKTDIDPTINKRFEEIAANFSEETKPTILNLFKKRRDPSLPGKFKQTLGHMSRIGRETVMKTWANVKRTERGR